jgi:hypothetical protein
MQPGGPVGKKSCRTGSRGWESTPELLKKFTNPGTGVICHGLAAVHVFPSRTYITSETANPLLPQGFPTSIYNLSGIIQNKMDN